ncbi:MAG TPA: aldo/keto reductase [Sinorhizobium sp.]|nr:aldo/keto reductase [Sinorhizobium sp.]
MERQDGLQRRDFLTAIGSLSVAALVPQGLFAADERRGDMIYREFGKTGEKISAIGLGGAHIGRPSEEAEAIRIIRSSIDRGINFMDNCWDYANGKCEQWMGDALRDGYREKVFLMTKFDGRTKESTARQIDESLKRLQTDRIDLMQYHENIRMDDPDFFFSENGPYDALMEAKKAGKIRYIGFTGHKDPAPHLRMLEMAEQRGVHLDSCQMPLNILDGQFRSFQLDVVPKLVAKGVAVLGMKPMAAGMIPRNNLATGIECLHYALTLPTSTVITGCDTMERLDQALEAAKTFKPLTQAQISALHTKTREAALSGQMELFKTSARFDGTVRNPDWMR